MCGIAGIVGRRANTVALEAMLATVGHRGPDAASMVVKGRVGLAAARLSLVDLTDAGTQPFNDDRFALAFNGEIYNHRALAAELKRAGVRLQGRSDTEVLFHALRLWGVEATVPRLRGMFALAFADFDDQSVWLARDRLGIKPLVWCEVDGGVVWASEAKALGVVRDLRPDPVRTLCALTGRIDRSTHLTPFEGVFQLPAGHFLRVGTTMRPATSQWWAALDEVDPSFYAELDKRGADQLADDLDDLLTAAVTRMASSDAPMGALLSGGVDSSLIASITATLPEPTSFFTADVGGERSELAAAQTTAAHLGRQVIVSPFPGNALLDDWARATWHLEAPLITHVNSLPFGRLAQTAHDHGVKSVLTGEGADELFFGYPESAAMRYRHVLDTGTRVRSWASRGLPGPYGPVLAPRGASQADFVADLVGHFDRADLETASTDAFGFLPPSDAERHGKVLVWLGEHLPTLLHRNDAMGMATSVEARFPYLDEELVRFGINLPITAKLANSPRLESYKHPFVTNKAIIRRLAARRLPRDIAKRPKAGFPMYGHHHLRLERAFWLDGYVADLVGLSERAIAHLGSEVDSYLAAKLASVEVFGRIFARDESIESVTDHVRRHAWLAE